MECDWLNKTKVIQEEKDYYPLVGLLLYFPGIPITDNRTVKSLGFLVSPF